MNSLYNNALKQVNAIQADLDKYETSQDTSPAAQGAMTASFASLQRTIDDYDAMAKREIITVKQEKAVVRVVKFREDLSELRKRFEGIKNKQVQKDRNDLLGRRNTSTATPENPFATPQVQVSRSDHAFRESDFLSRTESSIDDYISQGREALSNLVEQRQVLKSTQRRILDAANTLGLSRGVIRAIERRSTQDKWIFIIGAVLTFAAFYWILKTFG